MLNLIWLTQLSEKHQVWSQFNPAQAFWVVGDEPSRKALVQDLLSTHDLMVCQPVKTSFSLWREFMDAQFPEVMVLGRAGCHGLAREFLKTQKAPWCERPHAAEKLVEVVQDFSSLLLHLHADEILNEFKEKFADDRGPFLEVLPIAVAFAKFCLELKKIPQALVPSFLVENCQSLAKGQTFYFDLGFSLRGSEKDLITRLSDENDVHVLIPAASAEKLQGSALAVYRDFALGSLPLEQELAKTPLNPNVTVWRCSSPQAEARKAVEKIRHLIKQGVASSRIAIAAPSLFDYEDLLEHDLGWEGIGLNKVLTYPLSSTRVIRSLRSLLALAGGTMNSSLLEEAFLSVSPYSQKSKRRYEARVLKPVVDEKHLPLSEMRAEVRRLQKLVPKKLLTLKEFEDFLVILLSDLDQKIDFGAVSDSLLEALSKLRAEVGALELDYHSWVDIWNEIVSQIQIRRTEGNPQGIWLTELKSVENLKVDVLIVLGTSETGGVRSLIHSLSDEQKKFLREFGFSFSSQDFETHDSLVKWLGTGAWQKFILSASKVDSQGRAVVPSAAWVTLAQQSNKSETLDFATDTVFLAVQKQILQEGVTERIDKLKGLAPLSMQQRAGLLKTEMTGGRLVHLPSLENAPLTWTLSASSIEKYWECPFRFYAGSVLKLSDEDDFDVEPSPSLRGQWLHRAMEKILDPAKSLDDWNDEALSSLIDSFDEVQKAISSEIWPSIRKRFVRLLSRCVEFEKQWRKDHPRFVPQGLEVPLSGFIQWSLDDRKIDFAKEKPVGASYAPFRGRIDRVDGDLEKSQSVLVDYKSSKSKADNIKSWASKGHFQLAMYTKAYEQGLGYLESQEVVAAHFYTLQGLQRDKGFQLDDVTDLPQLGKSTAVVNSETREKFFEDIFKEIFEVLEGIRQREFSPKPKPKLEKKLCTDCRWSCLCRAPHLC